MALDVHERDQDVAALADADLVARAGRPEELLASYPRAARKAERQTTELDRGAQEIRGHEQRLAASRAERARLEERIVRQDEVLQRAQASYAQLADEAAAARELGDRWVEEHGVELADAALVERELDARRQTALHDAVIRAAHDPDEALARELGPRPESLIGREQWDAAATELADNQSRYGQLPADHAPVERPRQRAWQHSRSAVEELRAARSAPDVALPESVVEIDGPELGP